MKGDEETIATNESVKTNTVPDEQMQTSDNEFANKIRSEINRILSTRKPAAIALREVLLKNQQPDSIPGEIIMPTDGSVSPESAIREWRKNVESCLKQTWEHVVEIKQYACEIMGWLVLLCVDGNQLYLNGIVDLNKTTEVVIPFKTGTGTEVFVARLQERAAKLLLKGTDKALGEDYIDPAELELAFFKQDCLLEIKKLVYLQVFKKEPSNNSLITGKSVKIKLQYFHYGCAKTGITYIQ